MNILMALARSARADARVAASMYERTHDPEWAAIAVRARSDARDYRLAATS